MNKEQLMEIVVNTRNDNIDPNSPISSCLKVIEKSNYGEIETSVVYRLRDGENTMTAMMYFEEILDNLLKEKGSCVYRFREGKSVTIHYMTKEDIRRAKH